MSDELNATAVPPAYAALALGLTAEDWSKLGVDDDEDDEDVDLDNQDLHESLKQRMTSLLLVRLVALLAKERDAFPDMSSSTICRTVLVQEHHWAAYAPAITEDFVSELKKFVSIILDGYVSIGILFCDDSLFLILFLPIAASHTISLQRTCVSRDVVRQ